MEIFQIFTSARTRKKSITSITLLVRTNQFTTVTCIFAFLVFRTKNHVLDEKKILSPDGNRKIINELASNLNEKLVRWTLIFFFSFPYLFRYLCKIKSIFTVGVSRDLDVENEIEYRPEIILSVEWKIRHMIQIYIFSARGQIHDFEGVYNS